MKPRSVLYPVRLLDKPISAKLAADVLGADRALFHGAPRLLLRDAFRKAAGEQLVAALRWARYAAGRTSSVGMVCARLPEAILTDEEFLEMGWGFRESADDPEDLLPMRIQPRSAATLLRWNGRPVGPTGGHSTPP